MYLFMLSSFFFSFQEKRVADSATNGRYAPERTEYKTFFEKENFIFILYFFNYFSLSLLITVFSLRTCLTKNVY